MQIKYCDNAVATMEAWSKHNALLMVAMAVLSLLLLQ